MHVCSLKCKDGIPRLKRSGLTRFRCKYVLVEWITHHHVVALRSPPPPPPPDGNIWRYVTYCAHASAHVRSPNCAIVTWCHTSAHTSARTHGCRHAHAHIYKHTSVHTFKGEYNFFIYNNIYKKTRGVNNINIDCTKFPVSLVSWVVIKIPWVPWVRWAVKKFLK